MEEMALKTEHLTARLLKKELSIMHSMPDHVYVTHAKPQYLDAIEKDIRRLRIKNTRILRDGDIIRV
jgi:hypothetical protein